MAAGAEPRGRVHRRGLAGLALVALLACAGARHGAADIISLTGNLVLGVSTGNVCHLTATGLGVSVTTPSANLQVAGNAVVSGALVAGGTGNTSGSNLHISGTLGFSVQSVSANTTLSGNSVVLADASGGNITLTLPSPSAATGRTYTVKKAGNANGVRLRCDDALLDGAARLELGTGTTGYPFVQVVSDGSAWRVTGRSADGVVTAAAWTPAELATALWLDASNSGTVTLVSGRVSQWNDLSGNGRHATQGTAAQRPTYTAAAQNGLSVVEFDPAGGTYQRLTFSSIANYGHLFFVAKKNNVDYSSWLLNDGSADDLRGVSMAVDAGSNFTVQQIAPTRTDFTRNAWHVAEVMTNGTTAALGVDGSRTTGAETDRMTSSDIGWYRNVTAAWTYQYSLRGMVGEIVICSSELGDGDRLRVEGYLAWKWGLVANLPSGHLYKSAAP